MIAHTILDAPASEEAVRLVVGTFGTFDDINHLEMARAFGDNRLLNKLTNKIKASKSKWGMKTVKKSSR